MDKKVKYVLSVSAFFLISLFSFKHIIDTFTQKRIQTILNSHTDKIQTYYDILSYNQKIDSDVIYKETINNYKLIDILKKANEAKANRDFKSVEELKEEAVSLLYDKYLYYKEKGVLQYHFVFPDNVCFLRMHKPNKFGDDLSDVRSDFVFANENLRIVRGFAQGRTAHAFRNVYPIIDEDKKHLGAFEVSFSSELLQNYFTQVNKIHTHFLVKKDIFESHTWERDDLVLKYYPSSEHKNYMVTLTQDHSIEKCINENTSRIEPVADLINEKIEKKDPFSVYVLYEKKARVASFFPILHSITKEPVAWIVSYVSEPLINETIYTGKIIFILVFIILSVIFSFIYFIIKQKDILQSLVEEKTDHLSIVNKELEERESELKLINENLEIKIEKELERSRQKDKVLFEQTKMAALGEMIGNIAHQWRQPLSVISTSATAMILENEIDTLDDIKIEEYGNNINKNAQYLSKTIDDFRNFIKGESKKEKFNLKKSLESFLSLVQSSIKKYEINVILNVPDDLEVFTLRNELNQCMLNLFNNSKDAMTERAIFKKYIIIEASSDDKYLYITFQDNAQGIEENIIDKIFEPYFTTKHQTLGTGLGLNMVYRLITQGMNGKIHILNKSFLIEGEKYYGAKFTVEIPLE